MPERPIPPIVNEALRIGIGVASRATARFFDSVLKDVEEAFGSGQKRVKRARSVLHRRVQDSNTDE